MSVTNTVATTARAITENLETGNWYVNGTNSTDLYSQNDGAAYVEKYNDSWIHEIYGDYRTGQIAVRGKNNGTWQAWRKVLDSSNYTSYTVKKDGTGASGTWSISITGNAATATKLSNTPNTTTTYLRGDNSWQTLISSGTSTLAWNSEVTLATVGGTAIKAKLPANPNTNTDTKQKIKLATTTKAYITGVNASNSLNTSGTDLEGLADTDVYLTTTAG